jgi:GT2 family glycosyltransferase
VSGEVTVVIPTRDRPALLADALASVAAQEHPPARTIVVDDGSAHPVAVDGGAAVEVIRHGQGTGVAAARNRGLERVTTEWVAFLDDDDLWAPPKLGRQLAVAADFAAAFVWCSVAVVDARRRPVGLVSAAEPDGLLRRLVRTNVIGSPSAVLAQTELVRALGGFDEELALLADWDLWLRLATAAPGAATRDVLAAYTEHGGSMTAAAGGTVERELAHMARKHAGLVAAHGGRLGGPELARWTLATRRRTGGRLGAAGAYLAAGLRERDARLVARAPAALLGEPLVGRLRAGRAARRLGGAAWLEPYRRRAAAPAASAPAA